MFIQSNYKINCVNNWWQTQAYIRINTPSLCPVLQASECCSEILQSTKFGILTQRDHTIQDKVEGDVSYNLNIWNKPKNLIRHSASIKTSNSCFINITKHRSLREIKILQQYKKTNKQYICSTAFCMHVCSSERDPMLSWIKISHIYKNGENDFKKAK